MADDRNYEFTLPDLGEGVMEGEVVKWLVQPGQEVKADEPLLQIMTDKATVEIPSPRKAKVVALHVSEGDVIPVGTRMLTLELAPGETRPIAHHAPAAPPVGGAPAPSRPTPPPAPSRPAASSAPERPMAPPAAPARPSAAGGPRTAAAVLAPPKTAREVLATPATRALARQLGVDLTQVVGSGPAGRVTREDVEAAAGSSAMPGKAPAPAVGAGPREERVAIRGLRRKIAERMVQSAFTAPHVTHVDEVDMTSLSALRAKAKPLAEARGAKLSYLPFVMKALVAALRDFPYLNSAYDAETGELLVKRYYNLGFAAATEQGLLVPVVKGVEN
ncbi:MAG: 2-oxo acid dehydrogenase subunit E2, partial [Cyanobacteria bacterium REEB65]|nr:2-oxo acid dehydrogenase subunit E2 [Cyanobacteria bacterium REEB65]